MRDHLDRFGGATVAVVTFADPERLAAYRAHLDLSMPVLTDPDLHLYRALGVERARWRNFATWGTVRLYGQLLRRGRRLGRPTEDIRQLGADVVVGSDGRIRLLALPETIDARPPLDDLVAALS